MDDGLYPLTIGYRRRSGRKVSWQVGTTTLTLPIGRFDVYLRNAEGDTTVVRTFWKVSQAEASVERIRQRFESEGAAWFVENGIVEPGFFSDPG